MTPLEYALRWERRLRDFEEDMGRRYADSRDRVWLEMQRRAEAERRELDREIMEMRQLS